MLCVVSASTRRPLHQTRDKRQETETSARHVCSPMTAFAPRRATASEQPQSPSRMSVAKTCETGESRHVMMLRHLHSTIPSKRKSVRPLPCAALVNSPSSRLRRLGALLHRPMPRFLDCWAMETCHSAHSCFRWGRCEAISGKPHANL